ncbi:MAG: YicC/YloC family endoribonuclease [Pirellulaceae bacterium]|nr:YicC/YloC family endoribonuclease [Pirellulaceae bacterium]
MLLSMTGQGQGRRPFDQTEITVEVRAVNNRFLKIQTRVSDAIAGLEPQIETVIKQSLRRGSLQIGVFLSGKTATSDYCIQEAVLESYFHQCTALAKKLGTPHNTVTVESLLQLPGVVRESGGRMAEVDETLATCVLATVADAMESLNRMRLAEGQSMGSELAQQLVKLRDITLLIEQRAPRVIEEYKQRLHGRLAQSLAEIGGQIQETDLVREILVMADKADIREEVVRLRSHFLQFQTLLDDSSSQGRKLDFLIQEIFREVNTIGSKAGDAEIAQRVVDMKSIIEQMRELVQNVE